MHVNRRHCCDAIQTRGMSWMSSAYYEIYQMNLFIKNSKKKSPNFGCSLLLTKLFVFGEDVVQLIKSIRLIRLIRLILICTSHKTRTYVHLILHFPFKIFFSLIFFLSFHRNDENSYEIDAINICLS